MSRKKRIYVAEDFPAQVELLKSVFEKEEKFDATIVSDGLELYLKVQENPPDVLILDIILPTLSGLAITGLLKFDERFKQMPIIVISSITDPDIKERAMKVGADYFLPKPFQPQDLVNTIYRVFES